MDHFKPAEDRLWCNLCPKSHPKHFTEHLCFLMIPFEELSMRLSVRFWVMRPKYRQPNELKFNPRFYFLLHWWEEEPEYGLCCARCNGLLIFQPDFYQQFHPEINAAEIQLMSLILLMRPSIQRWRSFGGCKRRDCSGPYETVRSWGSVRLDFWQMDRGNKRCLNVLYNPRDDQGLEHPEGRHFGQISHASTGGFQAYLERYRGHNHWRWWYYAQVGEVSALWTHSVFVTNPSSARWRRPRSSTKNAAIELCRVPNLYECND